MLHLLAELESALGFDPSYVAIDSTPNRLRRALSASYWSERRRMPMDQAKRVENALNGLCAALSRYAKA